MNGHQPDHEAFEARVAAAARSFAYPPTPRPTRIPWGAPARKRSPALALAAVLLVLLLGAFAVPQVRAAVVEFIQVGVMRIFFGEPGILPDSRLPLLQELSGRTTLEAAAESAGLPVRYPLALGEPDEVYTQTIEGPLVLMVWFRDDRVEATLLALGPGAFAGKGAPQFVVETRVGDHDAVWLEGDHPLYLKTEEGGFSYVTLFDAGSTLLWEVGAITYRLEGFDDMGTAIRIAETLSGTP